MGVYGLHEGGSWILLPEGCHVALINVMNKFREPKDCWKGLTQVIQVLKMAKVVQAELKVGETIVFQMEDA